MNAIHQHSRSTAAPLREPPQSRRRRVCCSSSQPGLAAAAAAPVRPDLQALAQVTKVTLKTSSDCALAVSRFPLFSYNAAGGGGTGRVQQLGDNQLQLSFDAPELLIPALNWRTASVLGLPIPPPLNIAIQCSKFEGTLDLATGRLDLGFEAEFKFTVGSLYRAPALQVATTLTTEHSSGEIHAADGERLQDGAVKLVGVARVPKVDDWFLNTFLMLPTDALAVMRAQLEFT